VQDLKLTDYFQTTGAAVECKHTIQLQIQRSSAQRTIASAFAGQFGHSLWHFKRKDFTALESVAKWRQNFC